MFFLDILAIVYFIYFLPIPLASIFQINTKHFARFGNWNYFAIILAYIFIIILTFSNLSLFIAQRTDLSPLALGVGLAFVIMGFILGVIAVKELSLATLISLPQIHPDRYPSKLITTGVYGAVRHPRYTSFWMMGLGFALATGLLMMWLLFLWSVVGLAILASVEERELQQRFGKAYRAYMQKVPRFFPKLS